MNNRKPNWKKWNLIDDAEVWKVIALSLDLDPDKVGRDSSDWMADGAYVNHEGDEFKDRLDVIKANYSKIDVTPKTLSTNGIAYCHLNIAKFATWAISVNWEIPDELKLRSLSLELSRSSDTDNKSESIDLSKYRSMDLWSEADLQALLCGLAPDGSRTSTAELNDAAEQIRRAVLAGVLPFKSPANATAGDKLLARDRFFTPDNAIAWASDKFPKFPFKGDVIKQTEKPLFDKDSSKYPLELDLAMQAWLAVSNAEGKGKPKVRMRAWLDTNTMLSDAAKERISIVANWDKLGGATRTV